jgi:hypothetical protein
MKRVILLIAALLILPVALVARNAGTVTLDEPVTVGTSTLAAGTYDVTWTEPGPNEKVTFSRGKKKFAEVPATIVIKKNSDSRLFTATAGSGKVLQGLDLKNASLTFTTATSSK